MSRQLVHIRKNLRRFGLRDFWADSEYQVFNPATGLSHAELGRRIDPMSMSELCARQRQLRGIPRQDGMQPGMLRVSSNGNFLGELTDDGVFHYRRPPNLETCLGWMVATDGGRDGELISYSLRDAAWRLRESINRIRRSINQADRLQFETYLCRDFLPAARGAVEFHFAARRVDRLNEGKLPDWALLLWQVGTFDVLGYVHPGEIR